MHKRKIFGFVLASLIISVSLIWTPSVSAEIKNTLLLKSDALLPLKTDLSTQIIDGSTVNTSGSTENAAVSTSEVTKIMPLIRNDLLNRKPPLAQQNNQQSFNFEEWFSAYWVQFLALLVSLIGVALAVTGFTVAGSKKKKSISKLINDIDDTFDSFKWKSKRCEAELYRLQDLIEDKLKEGKIDEGAYHLLSNRIEKYLKEISEIEGRPDLKKENPNKK